MGMIRVMVLVLLLVGVMGASGAQESDPFAPYGDIPYGRAEDGAFVLGDADAPLTLVEFGDFMCPHCQRYHTTMAQFIQLYVRTGRVKLEYRLYPVVHPVYSTYTAQLAECADEQLLGGFWPAYEVLYTLAKGGQIGPDTAEVLAERLGISTEKLDVCTQTATQHETDLAVGEAFGVSGTPAVAFRNRAGELGWGVVNDQVLNRGGPPLELLSAIVEAEVPDEMIVVPYSMLDNLLMIEGCTPPCWRGIVPGETRSDEASAVIYGSRQFYEIQETTAPEFSLSWRSLGSGIEEPSFLIADQAGVIDVISVIALAPFSLGDVIRAQGEPEYAAAYPLSQGRLLLELYYPPKALVVFALSDPAGVFGDDSAVIGAYFLTQGRSKDLLTRRVPVDWAGYEQVEQYLR
jgi:protein-disulfide isomerase